MKTESEWDIFLSYAREERAWVEKYLYEPLLTYRTADGRRPHIFFDVEALDAADNWLQALAKGILASRKAVLVYSHHYFSKKMTNWELTKLVERDPTGELRLINPILIDPKEAGRVPFTVSHIHYLTDRTPDWFSRLCRSLELSPAEERPCLQFVSEPQDIAVNHTFVPPIRVAVLRPDGRPARDDDVTLSTETGGLHGTLKVRSTQGVAVFNDLLFDRECPVVRLVAWLEGSEKVLSRPFAVTAAATVIVPPPPKLTEPTEEAGPPPTPVIPMAGDAIFFAQGRAVAILGKDKLAVYSREGDLKGETPFSGQVRLVRRDGASLVVADWLGRVHMLLADGKHCTWDFADPQGGFSVVGDIALAGTHVYVGFWNGNLFRLGFSDVAAPQLVHEPGIQGLALAGDCLFVAGLDGHCVVYRNGHRVADHRLEPTVWMLKTYADGVVAVGEEKLYKMPAVQRSAGQVFQEPLHLDGVAAAWGDGPCQVVVDERGKGVRLNAQLIQAKFQVSPDAVPTSADDAGRYCVFLNADGSHSLLKDGRVVFSHPTGAFAVSPTADAFAVGEEQSVRVLTADTFEALLQGGNA